MTAAPDLSVLIVSHGHEDVLPACVRSLQGALNGLAAEIIVIDNLAAGRLAASGSDLPVRLFDNPEPMGFAANVNKAARASRGRHLLILNPDTEHASGALADAMAFLESRPQIGILGCRLLNGDGSPQQSYRQFPTLGVFLARGLGADSWPWQPEFYRRRMMAEVAPDGPHPVDWIFGAFMLVRRADFERLGGMDERFRLYYEDVDLCWRARRAGLATYVDPGMVFVHAHRRESAKKPFGQTWRWHGRSAARYFWKTRGRGAGG